MPSRPASLRRAGVAAALATLAPLGAPAAAEPTSEKRPAVAAGLALGVTAVGAAAFAAGAISMEDENDLPTFEDALVGVGAVMVVVGPSLGHLYAGERRHGLVTAGIRLAVAGTTAVWAGCVHADACGGDPGTVTTIVVVGGGVVAALAVYDLIDAPRAATRTNRRTTLALVPTGRGLAVAGTF